MKTIEELLALVDDLGAKVCYQEGLSSTSKRRKVGEYSPLVKDEDRDIWRGFLSDWTSDARIELYHRLHAAGAHDRFYAAPYHWQVIFDGVATVEYIEGDIHVVPVPKENAL